MENSSKSSLSDKEKKLLSLIRELGFGQFVVYVSDGQPVRVEEIRKSVKL